MPTVMRLVESVSEMRLASKKKATKSLADYPTQLAEDRVTNGDILIVPAVTSENRNIIPMGYFGPRTICTNAAFQVVDASKYLFGILNSAMHMS